MSRAPYGFEEFVTIGQEATYGTVGDGSNDLQFSMRPVSFGLISNDPPIQLAGPTGRPVGWAYDSSLPREFKGIPDTSGDIVFEMDFEDVGFFLKNANGQGPTSVLADVTAHTHTFNAPVNPVATMQQSLTIHRQTPGFASAGDTLGEAFRGCHIDKLTVSAEPNQLLQVTLGVIGQDRIPRAGDLDSFSATPWMEFHEAQIRYSGTPDGALPGTQDIFGGLGAASSWTFEIENNLRAIGATGVGKRAIREPIPIGYKVYRLTVTRDWIDREMYGKFFSEGTGGYANVGVLLTSDTTISGSSTKYALQIHMPAARIVSPNPEYGGGDEIIEEEVIFEAAYAPSQDKICQMILTNGANTTFYDDVS